MTLLGVIRWLADQGITATRRQIQHAIDNGKYRAPEKNDSGWYDYGPLDLIRLKNYFSDRRKVRDE